MNMTIPKRPGIKVKDVVVRTFMENGNEDPGFELRIYSENEVDGFDKK